MSTACVARLIGVAVAQVSFAGGGGTHMLDRQICPVGHTRSHAAQLRASFVRLAQVLVVVQNVVPTAQMLEHTLAEQAVPGRQTVPQAPQLRLSLVRLTSQPSAVVVLQLAKPVAQAPMPQALAAQPAVALAGATQARPQAPQLGTDVRRSVSQPLV